jgi:hypothetical protein
MNPIFFDSFAPLYETYNNVIKPLIAEIEARFERFPTSLFNEIRAFNDHASRCYLNPDDKNLIEIQASKAKGHIERIVLDCYKYLNVHLYDSVIKKFDRKYKGVDLSTINNGDFQIYQKALTKDITLKLKEAKLLETLEDKSKSINMYQYVHNKYTELEDLFDENCRNLFWARSRYYSNRIIKFFGWFIAAIVSGIISSSFIPWGAIIQSITSFFSHNP